MSTFDRITAELAARFVDQTEFAPRHVLEVTKSLGMRNAEAYKYVKQFPSVRRGVYDMAGAVVAFRQDNPITEEKKPLASAVQSVMNEDVYVPSKDDCYVAWGNSKDIEMIVGSKQFYPTYISGLSGNGKTTMVEQACAKLNREYVRVQITPETDEDDLLGGFRLIKGETVFAKGPVVKAMEAGALLLIDEIDRGSNKIMALQGVLEGKPVMIKKTGEVVTPAPGFNVVATANTKGRGSEDGRFIAATIIDEAFLERFTITMEQPYPTLATERKIINKHLDKFNATDNEFAELLAIWSETIRKTYDDGGVDEVISTRRLCHIAQTYSIFEDRKKAVELCVNRFDADVKEAFLDLYSKVDGSLGTTEVEGEIMDRESAIDDAISAAFN
jgi:MoxR-like ATPase